MNSLEVQDQQLANKRIEETLSLIDKLRYVGIIVTVIHAVQLYLLIDSYTDLHNGFILFEIIFTSLMIALSLGLWGWTRTYVGSIVTWHDLYQPDPPQKSTSVLFTLSMYFWAANLYNLILCYVKDDYIEGELKGLATDPAVWKQEADNSLEDELSDHHFVLQTALFVSLVSFVYYAFTSIVTYRGLAMPNRGVSSFLAISNITFLISSVLLTFEAIDLLDYQENPKITVFAPEWIFDGFVYCAPFLVFFSLIVAYSNFRKSRSGFLISAVLMIASLLFLINITGYGFRYARHTRDGFTEQATCLDNLKLLSREYVAEYSCASKYQLDEQGQYVKTCDAAHSTTVWEGPKPVNTPDTSLETARLLQGTEEKACLADECCGVVGNIYSLDLYQVSYLSGLTMFTGAFVAVGSFFLWWVNWMDSIVQPKKSDLYWLAAWFVLFGVGLIFFIIKLADEDTFYSIYPGTNYPPEHTIA